MQWNYFLSLRSNNYCLEKAAPVFFILDEKRVIRKGFRGYGEGSTDKEIREAIKELL